MTSSTTSRSRRRTAAQSAAPLEPPAGGDTPVSDPEPAPASSAAPLEPPVAPPPAPEPGEVPPADDTPTPGEAFAGYKWADTGDPADPDNLFDDPGQQYNYLVIRRPLVKVVRQPGARSTSETLAYPAGYRVSRWEADQLRTIVRDANRQK